MPEAILLQDVNGVGVKGSVVDVSKGYLRNFLIPRKLAAPATKGLLAQAQAATATIEKARAAAVAKATEQADLLNKTVLTLAATAGEDGRLFGSITNQDIADGIKEARGIEVDKRKIHLEDPIKNVGTYSVIVEIDAGVTATVKTIVTEGNW
ncbi:50S ribosomal protein L9 [Paraconexibacter antarcticus]|uniref:Large ribosomal subunit protein bL9 n=1 Tax=Paraconexibacter antarcticus TaxID=2949664 RepID=A0ABY5DTF3_9ACTN|nr:50S ribosomal protein L9 [Paraconexibacter antarcticus]UTI64558.1 50S ribosomal protein L9 [Paraconexibacter antarcticus]